MVDGCEHPLQETAIGYAMTKNSNWSTWQRGKPQALELEKTQLNPREDEDFTVNVNMWT